MPLPEPPATREVRVPAGFEGHAARLGLSVEELVWILADDLCARPPSTLARVQIRGAKPVGRHIFLTTSGGGE